MKLMALIKVQNIPFEGSTDCGSGKARKGFA